MTKPIRWGILSTANIADKVGRAIDQASNGQLVAVASRDLDRARSWADERGVERYYGSYAALLDDADIDAVYIPLPPSMHMEWTIKAARQGKHILCEKPLAANIEQARAMLAACQQHQVQLMDGVMWVHHDRTQKMKAIIDGGDLGALRKITAAFSFNWDKVPQDNIRLRPELGGGSLGDLGYYCVRAIIWALDRQPEKVYASARLLNKVDFNLTGLLWFADGAMASFDCGFDTALRKWFEVAGSKASLVCDDFVLPEREENSRFWIHGGSSPLVGEHKQGPCVQEVQMIESFCQQVQSGTIYHAWPKQALNTMAVCQALSESFRRGQVVELPVT